VDPITAGFNFGSKLVDLITKMYDDTPKEERVKDIMAWRQLVAPLRDMFLDLSKQIKPTTPKP
jgi:hypothetical protein